MNPTDCQLISWFFEGISKVGIPLLLAIAAFQIYRKWVPFKKHQRPVCRQRHISTSGKSPQKTTLSQNSNQPSFLKMSQQTENELLFTREVLCAMIERAVLDAKLIPDNYVRQHTKNMNEQFQTDAIHFLQSEGFKDICNALGLPSDKIRRMAYLWF